ncbi:IclR family transcriptional regulator [Pusillimonas sp. CC-YST705]|uniref:IclR family transcriptional regulator n=1 Tax=Mesopusillimonas faecipullorum TaxID=2755040 RepID=A0ABS8CFN9_9BURK|nr:IclR family transcriptional regulator [Mesopusillimonas faecipullorum]MCB5364859.1 IclR family transcriptional regulator [Mesopusillimonas faecipullorum]
MKKGVQNKGKEVEPELDDDAQRKPRGIQSVVIGFQILDCLAQAQTALSLKELGQAVGMPPSKLRFYLVSFLELGLVKQHGEYGRYDLGPAALKLGLSALEKIDVVRLVGAELPLLAEKLGYTAALSVWGSHGPTVVDRVDGRNRTVLEIRVGSVLPLTHSATGLVYAAWMPRTTTAGMMRKEKREWKEQAANAASESDLEAQLKSIRATRLACAAGSLLAGFSAIASPVLDRAGLPAAVISVVGAMGKMSDDPNGAPAQALLELTTRLSQQIGWRDPNQAQQER